MYLYLYLYLFVIAFVFVFEFVYFILFPFLKLLNQVSNPAKKEDEGAVSTKPANSMFQMMNHIQSLISMAVENAKQEEKSISHQKSESSYSPNY